MLNTVLKWYPREFSFFSGSKPMEHNHRKIYSSHTIFFLVKIWHHFSSRFYFQPFLTSTYITLFAYADVKSCKQMGRDDVGGEQMQNTKWAFS